jgi:hypothetical protein
LSLLNLTSKYKSRASCIIINGDRRSLELIFLVLSTFRLLGELVSHLGVLLDEFGQGLWRNGKKSAFMARTTICALIRKQVQNTHVHMRCKQGFFLKPFKERHCCK